MATETVPSRRLGATERRDRWWLAPLLTGAGLGAFGVYSAVVAVMGDNFLYTEDGAEYLSPFYSPDLEGWGLDLPLSGAFFVIWIPLGFRATCYYYRKAYYRAFFMAPPACGVAGLHRRRYRGESKLPFILMNAHRYFFFLAAIILAFLAYDAARAFLFRGSDGSLQFGVGVGTLVLVANVVFLSLFTFGCNSLRHLVGGKLDCFTCSAGARRRHGLWQRVTSLNGRHMEWAWISLGWVGLTDLYIRLASAGVFDDPRII